MPQKHKAIVVVDYDPAWSATFAAIQTRMESLLAGLVLDICHIGSTSVPGLCAKPKIDVDIVLTSAEAISAGIERLQNAGYTFHGDKYRNGMWAFTTGRGSYGERLYLCVPGTEAHRKRLLFRDYLRRHPEAAEAYGQLKRRLAAETDNDWDYYTGSKGPFVAEIVAKAEAERC